MYVVSKKTNFQLLSDLFYKFHATFMLTPLLFHRAVIAPYFIPHFTMVTIRNNGVSLQ